jgi:hypothetical protein
LRPVQAKQGNIFEGGADLTVLPCSAKGTVSSSTKTWLTTFGIPEPLAIRNEIALGDLVGPVRFSGPRLYTKYVCFAASVLNDATSSTVLGQIGEKLGHLTRSSADIRIVECPLLGTGAGRLPDGAAGTALAKGFRRRRHPDAQLWIWVYSSDRHKRLEGVIGSGFWERLLVSISAKPGFLGFSIDLKRLLGLEK